MERNSKSGGRGTEHASPSKISLLVSFLFLSHTPNSSAISETSGVGWLMSDLDVNRIANINLIYDGSSPWSEVIVNNVHKCEIDR